MKKKKKMRTNQNKRAKRGRSRANTKQKKKNNTRSSNEIISMQSHQLTECLRFKNYVPSVSETPAHRFDFFFADPSVCLCLCVCVCVCMHCLIVYSVAPMIKRSFVLWMLDGHICDQMNVWRTQTKSNGKSSERLRGDIMIWPAIIISTTLYTLAQRTVPFSGTDYFSCYFFLYLATFHFNCVHFAFCARSYSKTQLKAKRNKIENLQLCIEWI